MFALKAEDINVGYTKSLIVKDFSISIPEKKVTTIIGPNGCGKSTFLKTIARILKAQHGTVLLEGKEIQTIHTKEIAKKMAILPQTAQAPDGLTVYELISYGRFPHRRGFGSLTSEDHEYMNWAIHVTGLDEFKDRTIDALSGGQLQRVWIAMALAQGTDILILDEPTTYLDLAHQMDILLLLQKLNEEEGKTIVMVLHDLNHASRFSDYLIAMRDGKLITEGTPDEVMTHDNLQKIFGIDAYFAACPFSNKPICLSYQLQSTMHGQIS
ncbi:ABC transporter ATP-binding protein [Ornithinibacillus gellani]|uniref:ABC transporter ATP-binding protein n=1 Tax=Ornithinibacillus gellani TaxID=2293253 RepID=UPI000F49261F|nr:ABC transporter ATP-binding protein [Ornithinibacillus gellani]TQS70531.1 ABC transporter ATP-binding protein [Ornithinibacillus gellani]